MKKRKKQIANLLKLGVFLFGVSLLLWNCENDVKVDSVLENKQHRKYDLSIQEKVTITDEKLLKELRIPINTTSLYKSTNKQLSKNKTVEVNTNEVAIAKTPAYEVYTFPLKNYDTSYDFQNLAVVKREAKELEYLLLSYLKDNAPKNLNFPYKVYQQSLGNDLDVVFSEKQAKTQSRGSGENKCFKVRYLSCGCGGNADGHGPSGPSCCQGSPTLLMEVPCSDSGCGDCPISEDNTPPATNPDDLEPTSPSGDGGGGGGGGAPGPGGPIYIYEGDEECFSDGTCTPPLYVPTVLDINLSDILTGGQLLFLSQYPSLESEIKGFLRANNNSSEAQSFTKETTKLEMILNSSLEVKTTGKHPNEINDCCPGDCCPNPTIYDNDLIMQEYGIKPVQAAVDATFNIIASSSDLIGSDKWVGKRVRRIMTEVGMTVPTDIANEHLAALYQIRKRDGIVIVEYRTGLLKTMLSLGLDSLDMLAFLSPSKGGGAFLAAKMGGKITITKMTEHLRKISINTSKLDNLVSNLKNKAKFDLIGTGQYSIVRGHHPLAKVAFKSDKFYDLQKAFSVSIAKLEQIEIGIHAKITGQQNSLYSAFAKTGEVLTLDKMAEIEIKAMTNVGVPKDVATGWVIKALEDLKAQGVKVITNIPWNGIN